MPFSLPKDSEVRSMIDGNNEFDILKELRDRTIRATVEVIAEKFDDLSPQAVRNFSDALINTFHDYIPPSHNPICVTYKGGYHLVDTSKA